MRALRVLEYMCIIAGAFVALASIIGSVGGTLQLRSIAIGVGTLAAGVLVLRQAQRPPGRS